MNSSGSPCEIIIPTFLTSLAAETPVDLVGDDEIVVVDAEAAARVHHLIGAGGQWYGAAKLTRHVENQQHVFLLKRHIGERHFRHFAFENERATVTEYRRGGHALEDCVERNFAL